MSRGSNLPTPVFSLQSDRVKMLDMHPTEPLLVCALYSGIINLVNYETQEIVRSFDTGTGQPIRAVSFIPRLQSFVCGADDMMVRVYNYNTGERTKMFQAHDDYIRNLAVHDQLPLLLTCSDDMTIRQWDWSRGWAQQMIYEGHTHYVMAVTFNPKDPSTFASASLDGSVKVWSINNPTFNYQLEGHEDGLTCVQYYPLGDKPYLLSGSDDFTVRLWDYQTKACLQTFSYHTENVTAVLFHPDRPLIFTVAEDTNMKVISSETFRLLYSLEHINMNRGWTLAARRHTNLLAVGYDNGMAVFKIGEDKPVYSMDTSGRIIVAKGTDMTRFDVRNIPEGTPDGETLSAPSKDMGTVETVARAMMHGPSGQFIAVLGERDYTIISSLSLRPKSYGQGLSFTWGSENGTYAVLEDSMTVKLFKGFKERTTMALSDPADRLFPGPLLAVRTATSVMFYDWESTALIRQIDEAPESLEWSTSEELLALATKTAVFLLRYNHAEVETAQQSGAVAADGVDAAFDLVEEVDERVKQITWVGDCLIFINHAHRLCYYIGGEINNVAALSRNHYLLGYLPKENRILCIDKENSITSYKLQVNVIEYMAAIVRGDLNAAAEVLPTIAENFRYRLAQFLQARGHLDLALETTTEEEHRFKLAAELKRVDIMGRIAASTNSPAHWKQTGDVALEQGLFDIALRAFDCCGDLNGLLLIHSAFNDTAKISQLGDRALQEGKANVAFTCFHMTRRHADCVDVLVRAEKRAEAAFYARTYCPETIEDTVGKWKLSLATVPRISEAIANPSSYANLFPMVKEAKAVEVVKEEKAAAPAPPPVSSSAVAAAAVTDLEVPAAPVPATAPPPVGRASEVPAAVEPAPIAEAEVAVPPPAVPAEAPALDMEDAWNEY